MFSGIFGGDKRDRTADLLNAIQALSQLSYTPMCYIQLLHYSRTHVLCQEFFDFCGIFFAWSSAVLCKILRVIPQILAYYLPLYCISHEHSMVTAGGARGGSEGYGQ